MEFQHLRSFVAVAEALSFTQAAARLHVAQSPLSRRIARLEADLGVRLFDRSRQRVALTAAGVVLLDEARRLLAQREASVRAVRAAGSTEARLRLGFSDGATYDVLPRLVAALRAAPAVALDLVELAPEPLTAAVGSGELDAALLLAPVAARLAADDALVVESVASDPLILALPARHPAAAGRRAVPLASLAATPLLVHPRPHAPELYDGIFALCARAGFAPTVARHTTEVHVKLGLVAAGVGWAFALRAHQTGGRRPGIAFRAVRGETLAVETVLARRADVTSPAMRALAEAVRWVRGGAVPGLHTRQREPRGASPTGAAAVTI